MIYNFVSPPYLPSQSSRAKAFLRDAIRIGGPISYMQYDWEYLLILITVFSQILRINCCIWEWTPPAQLLLDHPNLFILDNHSCHCKTRKMCYYPLLTLLVFLVNPISVNVSYSLSHVPLLFLSLLLSQFLRKFCSSCLVLAKFPDLRHLPGSKACVALLE